MEDFQVYLNSNWAKHADMHLVLRRTGQHEMKYLKKKKSLTFSWKKVLFFNKCNYGKPSHTSACVVLRVAVGKRGTISKARWGQKLLNACTSGAEERLRGQGRFENRFWRALLFHYSRDSLMKSLSLCPPAIQRLCMLIANKAWTSF